MIYTLEKDYKSSTPTSCRIMTSGIQKINFKF